MVFLGSTVKVKDLKTGDTEIFRIVGEMNKRARSMPIRTSWKFPPKARSVKP